MQETLWRTLTTTPLFHPAPISSSTSASSSDSPSPPPAAPPTPDTIWTYTPSTPPPEPPLLSSLASLKAALPPPPSAQPKYQHTYQALSDLTGYIATQTYAIPHGVRVPGVGLGVPLAPEEEEVRREIRALKGLVLNRRSFMPRIPRPGVDGGSPGPVAAPA